MATQTAKRGVGVKKRTLAIVAIVVLLVVAAVAGSYAAYQIHLNTTYACNNTTLKRIAPYLGDASKKDELKKAVEGIKATKGYETNVNCVYVTTYYAWMYGSNNDTKTELAKLEKVYDAKVGYSSIIASHAVNISRIKADVQESNQYIKDFISSGIPSHDQ